MGASKDSTARLQKIQSHILGSTGSGRLDGKVCIITGVGSLKGIGRAAALLFAREGARHLYLLDLIPDNLEELKDTIRQKHPKIKVTVMKADAASEDAIQRICDQALEEENQLDVFFANAGVASAAPLHKISSRNYMELMRINTLSCFLAIKYASAAMRTVNAKDGKEESCGSIILTASVAGLRSGAGSLDYSASKAAVNSMAKTAAFQLVGSNIRVNSICPGIIETGMTARTFDSARERGTAAKIGQINPLLRYGLAEEVAEVAVFLAGDGSSYVNGQNWAVDGGLSSSHPVVLPLTRGEGLRY